MRSISTGYLIARKRSVPRRPFVVECRRAPIWAQMRRQVNEGRPHPPPILRGGGRIAHTRRMAAAPPASRRVVFITSKYWKATSKVGFHFLAQSFARAGWDVLFITTHLSRLAAALGKRRALARRARAEANRLVDTDGVASYAWYTPWHPVNLR